MISVENVSKSFTLHNQGSTVIPVMAGASLQVAAGECVALVGASGGGQIHADADDLWQLPDSIGPDHSG